MINICKNTFLCLLFISLVSCTQILEPVQLTSSTNQNNFLNSDDQDNFEIKIDTLTLSKAISKNNDPYNRKVMVTGNGDIANLQTEFSLLNGNLPPELEHNEYFVGIGDQLTFIYIYDEYEKKSIESIITGLSDDIASVTSIEDNIIVTSGIVGSDGVLLLLGVGRLDAEGKTLKELRAEVRSILISKKGLAPNFQLEISDFRSKKATIFGSQIRSRVVPITISPLSLKELAAMSGYIEKPDSVNLITLKRGNNIYKLNSEDLFDKSRKEILIQDKDQIEFKAYDYKPGQVYALSGTKSTIIPINASKRETLADVLFSANGPISNKNIKRSEIYLLRGKEPVAAYHLDAQKASRILIAAAMELRPNDIIYVAERPIVSFNRLLGEILPLRILLQDIQNDNIP